MLTLNNSVICYLCGKPLEGDLDNDHVPPKQFYGKSIRRDRPLGLLKIQVHRSCNNAYMFDEDYFVYSMSPLASQTHAGLSVLNDIKHRYDQNEQTRLLRKVFQEWDKRPSGLYLPKGKILKRIEGERIHRVAWKIVRGLFFHDEKMMLPDNTPNRIEYVTPDNQPPEEYFALNGEPTRGQHPGIFDYKYRRFPEIENMYYWAMLFWDAFMILMAFHNPSCRCKICSREGSLNAK